LDKVKNQFDRQTNKERLELAQRIRNKRALELDSSENGIAPLFKTKINFIDYFEKFISTYGKKDIRVLSACLSKFKNFLIEEDIKTITTKEVDENLVLNFKEYLESTLNGTSPTTYFKRFKKVLKQGQRDKVFTYNPAQDVSIKENQGISKDILTFKEIQLLFRADCPNNEVKRAFLFSCLTGLRYCDIITLKWSEIKETESGLKIDKKQSKTQSKVNVNLNNDAIILLGELGNDNELVFKLPSNNGTNKSLQTWAKQAGIKKKVTYHVSRHSFGTNLVYYGADAKTASALLGHKNMNYTNLYVNEVEALKEKSVNNLPQFENI
jgi:site-specific recombinase XerD